MARPLMKALFSKLSKPFAASTDGSGPTGWAWLLVPGGGYLFVLFVLPLTGLLLASFNAPDWSWAQYHRIGESAAYLNVLGTTLSISAVVTAIALVLGYPVAYCLATGGPRLRAFLMLAVVLPYFTSVLARTFAWMVLLSRGGVVNSILLDIGLIDRPMSLLYNRTGVIIGMTHIILPLMILPMYTVFSGIDRRLILAARANGAGGFAAFLSVFLPLSLPGVIAGVVLVFIYCLGFYITPALLGGLSDLTITMEISSQVVEQLNWGFGSALSIMLLAVVMVILWFGSRFFPLDQVLGLSEMKAVKRRNGSRSALMTRVAALTNGFGDRIPLFNERGVACLAVAVGLFLLLPLAIVAYLSFSSSLFIEFPAPGYALTNYQNYFSDADWIGATLTSLRVSVMAAVIATFMGAMLAFGLARGQVPGRGILVALVLSPIIMPTVIVAVATYFVLVQVGLQGTEIGLALGDAVNAIPFVVVIVLTNLRSINPAVERAALSLGASPLTTFRTITAPLVRPALIVASFFAFLSAFDDVVYVLFLGIGKVTTLPMRMWDGIKQDVNPTITAVATLQILVAAAVILIGAFVTRKRTK